MNPIDLILALSQYIGRGRREEIRTHRIETDRIQREDRMIAKLVSEQERVRRRRVNGL